MIEFLGEYITDKYIKVLKEILSGDVQDRISDRYPEAEARRPLVYLRTELPMMGPSMIADFVEEDTEGAEPVDRYEIRVPGVSTDVVLQTRSDAERKAVGDKLVLNLLLGRNSSDVWYKNRLGAHGVYLTGIRPGGTGEEAAKAEGTPA